MRRVSTAAALSSVYLLTATLVGAAMIRVPPRGAALFTVEIPPGWRSAESANGIQATSAAHDVELSIATSDNGTDGRGLDDEIARIADRSFTKLEFSNLHQRRLVNGRRFVAFRGSGRSRSNGAKAWFEIFVFDAGGKTGILYFRYRAASDEAAKTAETIVESVAPAGN